MIYLNTSCANFTKNTCIQSRIFLELIDRDRDLYRRSECFERFAHCHVNIFLFQAHARAIVYIAPPRVDKQRHSGTAVAGALVVDYVVSFFVRPVARCRKKLDAQNFAIRSFNRRKHVSTSRGGCGAFCAGQRADP